MSQLSELIQKAPQPGAHRCSVAQALQTLPEDSATTLQSWLDGTELTMVTDGTMHRALQDLGVRVGLATIGRHRRWVRDKTGDICGCGSVWR